MYECECIQERYSCIPYAMQLYVEIQIPFARLFLNLVVNFESENVATNSVAFCSPHLKHGTTFYVRLFCYKLPLPLVLPNYSYLCTNIQLDLISSFWVKVINIYILSNFGVYNIT